MLKTRRGIEALRQPDRNPRCYELTEQERLALVQQHSDLDSSHTVDISDIDESIVYYGA
jgi:hypothetical protein